MNAARTVTQTIISPRTLHVERSLFVCRDPAADFVKQISQGVSKFCLIETKSHMHYATHKHGHLLVVGKKQLLSNPDLKHFVLPPRRYLANRGMTTPQQSGAQEKLTVSVVRQAFVSLSINRVRLSEYLLRVTTGLIAAVPFFVGCALLVC
jgi:hypothetical protein